MGADFLFFSVPAFEPDPEKDTKRVAELLAILEALPPLEVDEFLDDESEEEDLDEARIAVKNAIRALPELLSDERNDTTTIEVAGHYRLVTGGMSWGDEPTDASKHLAVIGRCEAVWQQLLRYHDEDYRKDPRKAETDDATA